MTNTLGFQLINKTLFIPKTGTLVIGDLHLGYEESLREGGINFPLNLLKTTKEELKAIITSLQNKREKINKIILLGDLKHFFMFKKQEKYEILELLDFLEKYVSKENIILIKGNHDKIQINRTGMKYHDYYIEGDIAFTHGDKIYFEILDKKIKTIIIGHIHPAAILRDKHNIKKEKFKCYLIGKWKKKNLIILPSFLPLIAGTEINEEYSDKPGWSILTKKEMKEFKTYIIDDNGKILEFGKLKDLG